MTGTYVRPPKDCLPGVPPGSLLKLAKGTYGLREAPRLWHLRANEVLLDVGLEELQTAKAFFVLRHPTAREHLGMLVLHVDDAGFSGEGRLWDKSLSHIRKYVTLGQAEYGTFTFLGIQVHHIEDFTSTLHQTDYVHAIERVIIPKERRARSGDTLFEKAQHDYRSRVGQLAWPVRETMPRLFHSVPDLQQTVESRTDGDLIHANHILI